MEGVVKHWNGLFWETVKSPTQEVFKWHVEVALEVTV